MRKYLLKPLQCHYDNAHGEMTLKAKRGGKQGTPQQHNIVGGCGSGSGVGCLLIRRFHGLIPVCVIGQDTELQSAPDDCLHLNIEGSALSAQPE